MSALTIGKQLERIGRKGARATMGDLGLVAEALDCPLWVLMVPGISEHPELLDGPGLQRLTRLTSRCREIRDSNFGSFPCRCWM